MTALPKITPTARPDVARADAPPVGVLAVDARRAAELFSISLRTWRRMDSAGRVPRGRRLGRRKLWLLSDLRRWAESGFPSREAYEARLRVRGNASDR